MFFKRIYPPKNTKRTNYTITNLRHDITMNEYQNIINCLDIDYKTKTEELNSIGDKQKISFRIEKVNKNTVDFKIRNNNNIIYDWNIIGEQCPLVQKTRSDFVYFLNVNLIQNNSDKNFSNDNDTITNWVIFLNYKHDLGRIPIQKIQNTQIEMFNQKNKGNTNVLFIHNHLNIEEQNNIKQKIKNEYFQDQEINILTKICKDYVVDLRDNNYLDMFDFIWVDDSCNSGITIEPIRLHDILKTDGKLRYPCVTNKEFNMFFKQNNNNEYIYIRTI